MRSVTVRGHFGEYAQGRLGSDGPLGRIVVPCGKNGLAARLRCDGRQISALASESARRCLRRRGQADDPARRSRAEGFVIAHAGSARGLIFPKGEVPPDATSALVTAGLAGVLQFGSDDC